VAQAVDHSQARGQDVSHEDTNRPLLPTIATSRQAGANGPNIARAVGKRLGWPVYDRELLEQIALELGLRTQLVESVDERGKSWLEEWLQLFHTQPAINQSEYVRHLVEVLFSLAIHGGCVIVGRAAAQVLPEETTLRVRLVEPEARRVAALQERFDVSAAEARRWLEETDRRRDRFVRDYFHQGPSDPARYDLILNSSRLSEDDCADLIVAALRRLEARMAGTASSSVEAVAVGASQG
jgi:cytidylate kinase